MHWIDEQNKRMEESIKQKKELGLTEKILKRKEAQSWGGRANKGRKQSIETKRILSNSHIGIKRSHESVEKSSIGTSKIRWEQTLQRLSKQDILDAQAKHGNHQTNTFKELNISYGVGKKLCKHYGIELKKSVYEKSEWVRENQSEEVNVYDYDKNKQDGLGDYIGTYYSITEACRQLKILKSRPHATQVSNYKRNHTNGYVFRKINP
jgi:hypothetical protein